MRVLILLPTTTRNMTINMKTNMACGHSAVHPHVARIHHLRRWKPTELADALVQSTFACACEEARGIAVHRAERWLRGIRVAPHIDACGPSLALTCHPEWRASSGSPEAVELANEGRARRHAKVLLAELPDEASGCERFAHLPQSRVGGWEVCVSGGCRCGLRGWWWWCFAHLPKGVGGSVKQLGFGHVLNLDE